MDETLANQLAESASLVAETVRSMRDQAVAGPYVTHASEVEKMARAVSATLRLSDAAVSAGLSMPWAKLIAATHTLHYELEHRTREPETLLPGAPVLQLMDRVIEAAEGVKQAAPSPG